MGSGWRPDLCQSGGAIPPILESKMQETKPQSEAAAIRTDLGAIFVSMELSRSTWVITALAPGAGETMSKHSLRSGDVGGLLQRFRILN